MRTYSDRGKVKIKDLIWYIIVTFPLTSILKVYVGPLNLILTILLFALFFYNYYRTEMFKGEVLLCFYAVLGVGMNVVINSFHFYSTNMVFYFPFLILYFMFFLKYQSDSIDFFRNHKQYVDFIIALWTMTILVSLPLSSSYVYEGETRGFVSFAGTTFLLCPIAIFAFALMAVQYNLWHKKRYVIAMFVPSLCIMLGTTRTYLGVLACAWMLFLYTQIKNKKMYFAVVAIAGAVLLGVILLSPIKQKFIAASSRTEIGINPLAAFTSGRSTFWTYDILTMIKNNPIRILFGNGVNYLFKINYAHFGNPLWAHNDFIQIFSDYGVLGLLVYLGMFKMLFKKTFREIKISKMAAMMLIAIWAFNAFFNMFYTYFCATLSYPFYCMIIKIDAIKRGVTLCRWIRKIIRNLLHRLTCAIHIQLGNYKIIAECEAAA
ncbi:MAG: O-antigen ligase family protein [Blautia producta]